MWSKSAATLKTLTVGKNDIHDTSSIGTDIECQTDEEQTSYAASDLSIFAKYLELLHGIENGDDGFELKGFPNVLSVQKLLLQQSHRSHIQYTASEAVEACGRTQREAPSLILNNHLINLNSLKRPSKFEDCDSIIQHWHSHFPASKLKQYFANEKQIINNKVLLAATQGLMADSELLSSDIVDMKWTVFLEGALIQATSAAALECDKAPIDSMKNLLQDFNNTRVNAIEQNKTIIANTKKHQLLLENSISRMSRLSSRVALILGIQKKKRCFSVPNFSIVQLPRSPKPTLQKTYLMYFKGFRISISPMPEQANVVQVENSSNNSKNKSAIVLALKHLLHAGPDELQILHMRDLDSFFELKRQVPSIAL